MIKAFYKHTGIKEPERKPTKRDIAIEKLRKNIDGLYSLPTIEIERIAKLAEINNNFRSVLNQTLEELKSQGIL